MCERHAQEDAYPFLRLSGFSWYVFPSWLQWISGLRFNKELVVFEHEFLRIFALVIGRLYISGKETPALDGFVPIMLLAQILYSTCDLSHCFPGEVRLCTDYFGMTLMRMYIATI